MFRWYRDATKCYVYLSDVSNNDGSVSNGPSFQQVWEPSFRHSIWFTRGWTLQELLAPRSVEFFSVEGKRLGDKISLVQEIYEITGIAIQALQGMPLCQSDVSERISWSKRRETKREEDAAYSLLGIFDVSMPLVYGEGRKKAFIRLWNEVNQSRDESPALLQYQREYEEDAEELNRQVQEQNEKAPGKEHLAFYDLTDKPHHLMTHSPSYWRHLTVDALHMYARIYESCKDQYANVSFSAFQSRFRSPKAMREKLQSVWLRLKPSVNDTMPKNFTLAMVYMLHVEKYLKETPKDDHGGVGIAKRRRRSLKRFGNWVDCGCD